MGNLQKKSQNDTNLQGFHEKFKIVQILDDSNEMILSIPFEQKEDITAWEKLLKNINDCDSEFILVPKKYMIVEQGLCGSSGMIKIVYDCFTFSFQEQIKHHSEKFKHFEQPQIWYLLFAIISSVKQMDRLSMKVGDIRPYNIFVNQNGQVKLSGVYSWPRQFQNYLKTSFDRTPTYLAPQQLHQCRVGDKSKKSHIIQESFSIGLTLLHTCLLKPMYDLYNLKKFQFNGQKLQTYINELRKITFWSDDKQKKQKYSKQLIDIIVALLDLDQNRRLTSLQLFNELQPHAQQILNLKQFQVPVFNERSPIKQVNNKNTQIYKKQRRISPQYSSIKKKQFNQGQSLGFEMSTGFVNQIFAGNPPNKNIIHNRTPQKNNKSKQKLQISLNNQQNGNIHSRTSYGGRQNLSKEKYHSNPVVKAKNSQGVQVPFNRYNQVSVPSFTNQTSFNKGYEVRGGQRHSLNYTNINDNSYQIKYQVPPRGQYRFSSQPFPISFNQGSTDLNFHKGPYIPDNIQRPIDNFQRPISFQKPMDNGFKIENRGVNFNGVSFNNTVGQVPVNNLYPFTRNVDLTTSGYTYIEKNNIVSYPVISKGYDVSIVKPVMIGQSSLGGYKNGDKGQQVDFLKKIDEQLNKSKQMYPTSSNS